MSEKIWSGTWLGGRIYGLDGRTVYVLEKMRHGRRYSIPLDVKSERDAQAELALFERDPAAYAARREDAEGAPRRSSRSVPRARNGSSTT